MSQDKTPSELVEIPSGDSPRVASRRLGRPCLTVEPGGVNPPLGRRRVDSRAPRRGLERRRQPGE